MRKVKQRKMIVVDEETHAMLKKECKEFEKTIGGGKWSICDTINELHKIAKMLEDDEK